MLNIKILASCFKKCVIECYLNAFLSGDRADHTQGDYNNKSFRELETKSEQILFINILDALVIKQELQTIFSKCQKTRSTNLRSDLMTSGR